MLDEREANVLFPLFVCGGLSSTLLSRELKDSGLTPWEFGVLSAIGVWGPLTPTELARRVGLPPTTLSEHIARFTERKLVTRTRNLNDGRSYLLELTDDGRRRHRQAGTGLHAALAAIADNLDVTPKEVRDVLLTLERALRAALGSS